VSRILHLTRHLLYPLLLAFCAPCFCQTNGAPNNPGSPQATLPVNPPDENMRSKLVSPGKGWVTVGKRLFWTENNGKTWQDITPPNEPADRFGPAFFLDRSHGWVTVAEDTDDYKDDGVTLLSTNDGGKAWQTLILRRSVYKLFSDMSPSAVFFSDPRHGWILWSWASMNSYAYALLGTTDGGRTWKLLPEPPGGGPMDFTSALDGWMIGDPEVKEKGIGGPRGGTLWATHDGGVRWKVLPVPNPTDSFQQYGVADVKFTNRRDGMLAARKIESIGGVQTIRSLSLLTQDGGKTWRSSQFEGPYAFPSFGKTHIFWSIFRNNAVGASIRRDDQTIARVSSPSELSVEGGLGSADFVDDSNAWAIYTDVGGGPSPHADLISSSDGGKTFQIITPPAAAQYLFNPPKINAITNLIMSAGGPMDILGQGFLSENTVWLGSRQVPAASKDGSELLFLIPPDVAPGDYSISIENAHGKSNTRAVSVSPQQSLRIYGINDGESTIHPGQQVFVSGRGYLIENTVWFGTQVVAATLTVSGVPEIDVVVPPSISPGPCQVYVSNASGKSNVISVTVVAVE
jgi:photosystem II stability/assembly factor-like uncharacterized protein